MGIHADSLALFGGEKIKEKLFPQQITIGREEKDAVNRVLKSGRLSAYRGSWGDNFYGGHEVQNFEREFAKRFDVKYATAVNSCTSALQVACGAIGLQPGDEVIVSPFSMSCSATAPLMWGATPVFADIEQDYFCLAPESVRKKITKKTKAIIVVDLFGQPCDWDALNEIAKEYGLYIIEDAAQAIGSTHNGKAAGTLGDIGCFSFTQGKHLTAGEGGMIVTNDPLLSFECQLIRNHAEAVLNDMNDPTYHYLQNMIGYNMRMTEIQAAILREQLKKLDNFVNKRQINAELLYREICKIPYITPAKIRDKCTHSYYVQAFLFDEDKAGISRDKFINAVKAELTEEKGRLDKGVPIGCGYIKPLYRMPLFKNGAHYALDNKKAVYEPVVERLWRKELFITTLQGLPLTIVDRNDIVNAFYKTARNVEALNETD